MPCLEPVTTALHATRSRSRCSICETFGLFRNENCKNPRRLNRASFQEYEELIRGGARAVKDPDGILDAAFGGPVAVAEQAGGGMVAF